MGDRTTHRGRLKTVSFTGDDYDLWWTIVALVVMSVGLVGVLVPVVPGLALIWAAALIYGLLVGFGIGGWVVMGVLTLILGLSLALGVILPRRAAAGAGASGWSQLAAMAGGVVGFFVVPVIGLILGALAGLVLTEYALKGDWNEAWAATKATAKGFGISAAIDLALGLVMIVLWASWAATVVW